MNGEAARLDRREPWFTSARHRGASSSRCVGWRGVRTPRWTYAEDGAGPWLLYDLERDPYQLENLVARPELAEKRVELARELGAWAARLDDPRTSPRQQALAAGAGDELSGLHTRILEELQPSEELARRLRTYLEAGEAVPCRRF